MLLIDILHQITHNQIDKSTFSPKSLFPSYRYNTAWFYRRPDSNLFFTAISAFTLQRLLPLLSADERLVAQGIIDAAVATYPAFQNKDGLRTYNFYATNPSRHFPHGWLMHRFRHFKLPDDIDDTAMVYLTTTPTPADLDFLHHKLAQHANRTGSDRNPPTQHPTIQNTYPDYRDLRAYSTWFGQRMPIEFDACALANMLYCVYEYALPLDAHALDSLTLLADVVRTDRYRANPFRCAPNYAQSSLVAYHIARLLAAHDPAPLQPIRAKLIRDLRAMLATETNPMQRVVLSTSLLRLGEQPPATDLTGIENTFSTFSFFVAGMLSAYEQPLLRRLAPHPFWHIRWQCADHCRVLVLEYQVLARQLSLAI